MQVVGVAADPDVSVSGVAEAVVDRLDERGRVAVVDAGDVTAGRTVVTIDGDAYRERGTGRNLEAVLDDLARAHDYAVVSGFPEARLPTVAVGDVAVEDTLVRVDAASELDLGEVVAEVDELEPYECLASLVADVKRSANAPYAGAIATFTGRVRAKEDETDDPTTSLTFEKYDGVAEDRLDALQSELESRDGVLDVRLHHRTGTIPYGDDIVFVVVLAGHRREAFETVEDGIDRLKDEVPIFKKEVTVGDEFWVHERP